MPRSKTFIITLMTLIIGFGSGFILRPLIAPTDRVASIAAPSVIAPAPREARGTQYFVAHVDEARQIVAGCRDGSVRGGECARAEEAIIKVESAERRKRFLGK